MNEFVTNAQIISFIEALIKETKCEICKKDLWTIVIDENKTAVINIEKQPENTISEVLSSMFKDYTKQSQSLPVILIYCNYCGNSKLLLKYPVIESIKAERNIKNE